MDPNRTNSLYSQYLTIEAIYFLVLKSKEVKILMMIQRKMLIHVLGKYVLKNQVFCTENQQNMQKYGL